MRIYKEEKRRILDEARIGAQDSPPSSLGSKGDACDSKEARQRWRAHACPAGKLLDVLYVAKWRVMGVHVLHKSCGTVTKLKADCMG